jgi:hypothetical protein
MNIRTKNKMSLDTAGYGIYKDIEVVITEFIRSLLYANKTLWGLSNIIL